jgi:hypothetical protein
MRTESIKYALEVEYRAALSNISTRGNGLHRSLFLPAIKGVKLGLSQDQIVSDITSHVHCNLQKNEVENTVRSAFQKTQPVINGASGWSPAPRHRKRYGIKELTMGEAEAWSYKFINAKPKVTADDLACLSPICPKEISPADFIEALFQPDEHLCIGDEYTTKTAPVTEHAERLRRGFTAPQIWVTPFNGQYAIGPSGKPSQRLKDLITARRFCSIEFDDEESWPLQKQAAFWYGIILKQALPVAALIYSGGKSIHAWIHIAARNADDWERLVVVQLFDKDGGIFAKLGADTAAKQPMHGSRLPGHQRVETGRTQNILYFNPQVSPMGQACSISRDRSTPRDLSCREESANPELNKQ